MSLPILDVAIGISFVYLLLALICTTVNEMLAGMRKTRARFLDLGIYRLLGDDQELKKKLYQHPLIRSLTRNEENVCPSYISSANFATALMDVLAGSEKPLTDVQAVRVGAYAGNERFGDAINAVLQHAGGDAALARAAIENWFDDAMDRVSGWYKRHTQLYALILAAIITLVLNADTLHIADVLWTSPTIRAEVVEAAKVRSQKARPEEMLPLVEYKKPDEPTESDPLQVEGKLSEKEQELLGQLTGWGGERQQWQRCHDDYGCILGSGVWFVRHLIGWILTMLAVSIGAPFWFDTLNRFMNIRNAGRAPDEPRDKSSKSKDGK